MADATFFGSGSQMATDLLKMFDEGCDNVNDIRTDFNRAGLSKDGKDYLIPLTNSGAKIRAYRDNAITELLQVATTETIDEMPANLVTFLSKYDKVTGESTGLSNVAYNTELTSEVQKPNVYSVAAGSILDYSNQLNRAISDLIQSVRRVVTDTTINLNFSFDPVLRVVYDDNFVRLLQAIAINYNQYKDFFEDNDVRSVLAANAEAVNRRILSTSKLGFKVHPSLANTLLSDFGFRTRQAVADFLIGLEVEINKFNDQLESEGISLEKLLVDFTSESNMRRLENEQIKIDAIYANHSGVLTSFKTYIDGAKSYAQTLSSMFDLANTALDFEGKKLKVTEQKGAIISSNVDTALAAEKINKQVNDLVFKDQEQITNLEKLEDDINKQLSDYFLKIEEQEVDKMLVDKKKEFAEASASLILAQVKAEMAEAYLTVAKQEIEKYKLEIDFEEAKAMYEASAVKWNGPLAVAGAKGLGQMLAQNSIKLSTKKGTSTT